MYDLLKISYKCFERSSHKVFNNSFFLIHSTIVLSKSVHYSIFSIDGLSTTMKIDIFALQDCLTYNLNYRQT